MRYCERHEVFEISRLLAMTIGTAGPAEDAVAVLTANDVAALEMQLRRAQDDLARALAENEHLKAQFLQAQKMETVGRLASGVAHDFKNVLTLIAGYAEHLLNQADDPRVREPLLEIRAACQRAVGLTQQLLSVGRKEAVDQEPLSLNTILDDAGTMLRRMIGERIDLVIEPDPAPGLVMANAGQLHHLLLNLVVNARDAMPDGGRLSVSVRNADVAPGSPEAAAGAPPGRHVVLSVSDTGIGMDEETRHRALEPFFTTKARKMGTGLGLSMVHSIAMESSGRVVIESERGVGTAVSIYLPRLEERQEDERSPEARPFEAAPSRPRRRILVVDQDEAVRALLRDMLAVAGYDVEAVRSVAGDGAFAVNHDLAVVDLATLEEGDPGGLTLLGRSRAKILGISGAAPARASAEARFPVAATIGKPIVPRQLLRVVRDLLEAD